jgi:protein-tyrosine phosphatase
MAEALLDRRLRERGVTGTVGSAGRLPGGRTMTPEGLEVMREHGLDLGGHRSREATPALVGDADLVLGMAREHVRDAATLAADVVPRAFTLKELVRRGEAVGPRAPGEPLGEWLTRAAAGRRTPDLLGSSPDDDVPDPIGEPIGRYRAVADEIAAATDRLVNLAWPTEPDDEAGPSRGRPPGDG